MDNANGKVAIITGGSRGIGAAIAERLAKDGLKVVINYAGSTVEAEALAGKIERAGGRATAAQADVSDPAAVARLFDATDVALAASTCWSTTPASCIWLLSARVMTDCLTVMSR